MSVLWSLVKFPNGIDIDGSKCKLICHLIRNKRYIVPMSYWSMLNMKSIVRSCKKVERVKLTNNCQQRETQFVCIMNNLLPIYSTVGLLLVTFAVFVPFGYHWIDASSGAYKSVYNQMIKELFYSIVKPSFRLLKVTCFKNVVRLLKVSYFIMSHSSSLHVF